MTKEKILLLLLPFWEPQIPPSGLSCLKSFLQDHGYPVKTVDANVEVRLNQVYRDYFDTLKKYLPESKSGHFFKIGYDVLRNHMMARLHRAPSEAGDHPGYVDAIRTLVRTSYNVTLEAPQVMQLDRLVDAFFQRLETYLVPLMEKEQPEVLGISVYSDTLAASLLAFKLVKQRFPGVRTVMGGGLFVNDLTVGSPNLDTLIQNTPYIDHIIIGEGERLLLKLLKGELPPDRKVYTLDDIDREILDISTAGAPDFSDFDLTFYPHLGAYTSRSCPFQCQFCTETIQWGRYRKKPATQVAEEFKTLYRRHGSQLFLMMDSLLNPVVTDLSRALEQEEVSIYWDGYLRADRPVGNRENTMLWRRGGFYRARLGIESGSPAVLEMMNKKNTVEDIRAAVSALAYAGIKTTTYWVVGFPGETEAHFQETLDLIEEMADDLFEADCTPFWYYFNAQVGDQLWVNKSRPLYTEEVRKRILLQTWYLELEPSREESYRRMYRFVEHCKQLGIPNAYSLHDFHQADLRWQKLHKNAVPPLVDFDDKDRIIDENKHIKEVITAKTSMADDGDFGF